MYTLFCCKKYKKIKFKTWEKYQRSLNENVEYCKTIDYRDMIGKVDKVSDLPSYHPYWKFAVYVDSKKTFLGHHAKYDAYKRSFYSPTAKEDPIKRGITAIAMVDIIEKEIPASKETIKMRRKEVLKNG